MVDNQNGAAAVAAQVVIPEMPASIKNRIEEMGCSNVVLVIQKRLTKSDTRGQYIESPYQKDK